MPESIAPLMHRAARIEDAIHALRERLGRKRGMKTTVIPYTGYGSPGWVRVFCRVLLAPHGGKSITLHENVRGWRSFFSIPVDDVDVSISIGGVTQRVQADRGGVVDLKLAVDLTAGWHIVTFSTDESEPVTAPVFVVDPATRFGIVSDVDDTVMVTALPRPLLAAWNTFVLNEHARTAVPGMAVLYERLRTAHPGAPVIYLSTGAWNVAPTLTRFLERNLYPSGALLLTDWGPTHDRWFRSGPEHKRQNLRQLAEEFPGVRWLLVGDDGQHDEDLYGEFVREWPDRVTGVAIRELSPGEAVLAGGRSTAAEHEAHSGAPWMYAPDGAGLAEQLEERGILPSEAVNG